MIFSSLLFVFCFLPVVTAVYYALKPLPIAIRNVWLFLTSLLFYAWGEPKFVLVMVLSILVNYALGLGIERLAAPKMKKMLLCVALCLNIGLLFVFKYLNFATETVNRILPGAVTKTSIALPIGISFFTFQAISYVVDVYRGKSKAQGNPLNVGLYIAFFPQLIAGPIVRYDTVADQILNRKESVDGYAAGVERFLQGFCKKILLANTCGIVADEIFGILSRQEPLAGSMAWIGIVAYTLQIFMDFSAYSDMAIGLGKMFGFEFNENFNYPYIASSVTDFWRRWHISLSGWFRDYVYIPLGGSRVGKARLILNLFVVWGLTGLWHGANWTFILWGLWYFVLLVMEKMLDLPQKLEKHRIAGIGYRFVTLLGVMIAWVFFRAPSLSRAKDFLKVMFGFGGAGWWDDRVVLYLHENWIYIGFAILLATPVFKHLDSVLTGKLKTDGQKTVYQCMKTVILILLFLLAVSFLVIDYYNPFIYFNF